MSRTSVGATPEERALLERRIREASAPGPEPVRLDDRAQDRENDAEYDREGGRVARGVKAGAGTVGGVRNANPKTSLGDPSLAIWLYTAVVGTAILFSAGWLKVRAAITEGFHK